MISSNASRDTIKREIESALSELEPNEDVDFGEFSSNESDDTHCFLFKAPSNSRVIYKENKLQTQAVSWMIKRMIGDKFRVSVHEIGQHNFEVRVSLT